MAQNAAQSPSNAAAYARCRLDMDETGLSGEGVVICVIDYGFDLYHPTLLTVDGRSRFATIVTPDGRILRHDELNRLIGANRRDQRQSRCNPIDHNRSADEIYDPHANYFGSDGVIVGAHGTWVASIAAGGPSNPSGADFGIAPGAKLIGVHLDLPDCRWREEDTCRQPTWLNWDPAHNPRWSGWRSYEEAEPIANAIEVAFNQACALGAKAIVINLSIGAWAGPHAADSRVARTITKIVSACQAPDAPICTIVVGTGNAGADRGHFSGRLSPKRSISLDWHIPASIRGANKLELWLAPDVIPHTTLKAPDGTRFEIDSTKSYPIMHNGIRVGIADVSPQRPRHRTAIRISLQPSRIATSFPDLTATRPWRLQLEHRAGEPACEVHAWVERDCSGGDITTLSPTNNSATLSSLACAPDVIAVGAFDTTSRNVQPLALSGRGPAPWQDQPNSPRTAETPHVAAPGSRIWGARSKTNGFMCGSGTSAATAIVSGAAAQCLEFALHHRLKPDRNDILRALVGTNPTAARWSAGLGYGPLQLAPNLIDPMHRAVSPPEQSDLEVHPAPAYMELSR